MKPNKKPRPESPAAQIAARVAPNPRKQNVVKKVYAEGSPGALRKERGTTLTKIKASINEPEMHVVQMLDENDNPVGEPITTPVRNTAACTARRRRYIGSGLLGSSNIGSKRRHVRNSYAACNTGNKPAPVAAPVTAKKRK